MAHASPRNPIPHAEPRPAPALLVLCLPGTEAPERWVEALADLDDRVRISLCLGTPRQLVRSSIEMDAGLLVHAVDEEPDTSARLIRCLRSVNPNAIVIALAVHHTDALERLIRHAGAHAYAVWPDDRAILHALIDDLLRAADLPTPHHAPVLALPGAGDTSHSLPPRLGRAAAHPGHVQT